MRDIGTLTTIFPVGGVNVVFGRATQPERTCANALNVRAFDTLENRARGGIRPGLSQFVANADEIQFMSLHTGTGGTLALSFTTPDGNTVNTGAFSYAAAVAAVQTAIDNAFDGETIKGTAYSAGDITVSGGPTAVKPLIFTFDGTSAAGHNWGAIVPDDANLTGGSAGTVYTTQQGGHSIFAGAGRIQDINYVSYVRSAISNTNAHTRETRAVVVSNGVVQQMNSTEVVNAQITGNAVIWNEAPFVLSTELFGKLYFVDGLDYKIWTASTGNDEVQSMAANSASGGTFVLKFLLPPGNGGLSIMTGALSFGAAAAAIQTAVDNAFSGQSINGVTYSAGDITVSGGAADVAPVVFTFDGDSAKNRNWPLIFVDGAKLTGGSAGAVTTTTPGSGNVTSDWTVNTGTLPGNPGNTTSNTAARLIETWDARLVLAGLRTDPHNLFMTAKGDPLNIDYAPNTITELSAVTLGGTSELGKLGDIINALIPYSDDILIIGGDHSIYQLSGNPLAGGRMDNITTRVGMPFGRPWCKDPEGNIYFFSSLADVYKMPPYGAKPKKISDNIHPLLQNTNLKDNFVRMEWDDDQEGVRLWLSPFVNGAATHWFFDARTLGWFPEEYANNAYNPIAVKLFDGDAVGDRVILQGGEDGKIRFMNTAAATDDGNVFPATVTIGPFFGANENGQAVRQIVTGIQTRTDPDGVPIKYEILIGETPEAAQDSEAGTFVGEGTLNAGFSYRDNPMKGDYFVYAKLGTNNATSAWAMEGIHLTFEAIASDTGRLGSS